MNTPTVHLGLSMPAGDANRHRFAHDAMATTFELFILNEKPDYAEAAALAAFEELDRLEQELSRFVETSDVSRINRLPVGESLRVGIAAFDCLQLSEAMSEQTGGAFDVTVGSSVKGQVVIDAAHHAVGLSADRLQIDLGGIGKGYALDRMAERLRDDWGVETALLHGGQSSLLAIGAPSGCSGWVIALRNPVTQESTLATVTLRDRALSGSGRVVHGEHILDPKTGHPTQGVEAAWAMAGSAAVADALSTAFMVMTADAVRACCQRDPKRAAWVLPVGVAPRLGTQVGDWT